MKHDDFSGILQRVRAFCEAEALLTPLAAGKPLHLAAAVSGGADSMALLHLLLALQAESGFVLSVCHVNHGLRGETADRDEAFVREACAELGLPLRVFRPAEVGFTVPPHAGEDWARRLRYACFEQLRQEGIDCIATAHTASDQAETLLFRLARGTGLHGAGGIRPKRPGYCRPLLGLTRAETEAVCMARGQRWVTDETNTGDDYARNRLRHAALPALGSVNEAAEENLARFCEKAARADAYFARQAATLLEEAGQRLPPKLPAGARYAREAGEGVWALEPLQKADPLILETALHSLTAPVRDAEEKYIRLLAALVRRGSGAVQLTGDTQDHMIQVAAPNGEQSTYTLHIQKVASVPVTLAVPSGTTVQVINGAGSEIAPVDGIYHLVPGESYTCIATKNTWYHTQITFTASSGLNVSVPEPVTTDWLTDLAFYNGTYASSRIAYAADKTFTAADHTYNYTVSDCNSSVAMQATATGTVTALYRTQSTVPEIHNLARMETITTPVSKTGLAQSLTYAVAKAGYGQTVTIRISKTENGTTYYQDYDIQLLRQLHLSSLTIATKDETLPFVTPKGATARFDRDTTDYYVKVDRETAALYLSGTYPNSSTDTACCGGYYAKVNGVRYDTLAGAEAVLNTDLYNEDISVQVCHADTGSIELTYTVHVQKSDPIQLTIQTTPADATVFLTNDLNGKRIVEKNGTYSLTPGASYSYTTTCAGYIGQTVEHYTAPDKDGTLTITLKKAPANDKLINFDSAWPHLRQNNENNGVVDYKTPVYAKDAELYWATSIGSGYDVNACGCPILVDGAIYTYSGSRIYKVDAISGEILIDKPMDHNSSFAINPPTYANGMIFVGLSDGTIQAFDANTLDSLWIYRDSIGGQPNSSIVYHDGYIYTGFWVGEINEAHYVCLSATDEDPTQTMEGKLPTWYYTSKGGFYWAGAYVCDDFLLIGTDDGASGYTTGKPSLLSFNPKTGELLSSYKMNVTGDIRSSITHYNGKYYFTSRSEERR